MQYAVRVLLLYVLYCVYQYDRVGNNRTSTVYNYTHSRVQNDTLYYYCKHTGRHKKKKISSSALSVLSSHLDTADVMRGRCGIVWGGR